MARFQSTERRHTEGEHLSLSFMGIAQNLCTSLLLTPHWSRLDHIAAREGREGGACSGQPYFLIFTVSFSSSWTFGRMDIKWQLVTFVSVNTTSNGHCPLLWQPSATLSRSQGILLQDVALTRGAMKWKVSKPRWATRRPRQNSIMGNSEPCIRDWDWKQGATSWGGSPGDFIVMKIKLKRNSTNDNFAQAPRDWVGCPLVYLIRSSDIQKLCGNYISTGLVHIKSNYVPK